MKKFLTVNQTAERFPAFTRAGLRHLIFNAPTNGFDTCLRRIGRKVLICEEEFYAYVNNARPSKISGGVISGYEFSENKYSKMSEYEIQQEESKKRVRETGFHYQQESEK